MIKEIEIRFPKKSGLKKIINRTPGLYQLHRLGEFYNTVRESIEKKYQYFGEFQIVFKSKP